MKSKPSRFDSLRHEQSGATLLEVMITVVLAVMILLPLGGFFFVSLRSQSGAKQLNRDSSGIGLTSTYFVRDVQNSMVGASSTDLAGNPRPAGDLVDCIGGSGSGGEVRAVLITPANRRIVYSVGERPANVNGSGRVLWRRECPNLSSAGDATLNDTILTADTALLPGYIDPSIPGNNGSAVIMTADVDSVSSSCPLPGGTGQEATCQSMKLVVDLIETVGQGSRSVVLQATRRVNSYAPPGTPPVARFTYRMESDTDTLPPQRTRTISFDASTSVEPRGEDLTYTWDLGDGTTATGATVTHAYSRSTVEAAPYTVVLTVSSVNGTAQAQQLIRVIPIRPTITITSSTPLTGVQNTDTSIGATITTSGDERRDGTVVGNYIASVAWDWGDGSDVEAGDCAEGAQTCSTVGSHVYSTTGVRVVRLTVTDALGQVTTRVMTVTVRSGIYYVSASSGADSATCGPQASPCATITQGLARALAERRTQLRVTGGTYPRFAAVNGISVAGGYSSDFSARGESSNRSYITPAVGGSTFNGVLATGVDRATSISGFTVNAGTAPTGTASAAVHVEGASTALTLTDMTINGSTGAHATGVLVSGASTITIADSTVTSGTTVGAGFSAYGVRVIGASHVNLDSTNVTAAAGNAGDNAGIVPGQTAAGCTGNTGGNSGGSSSRGAGASACGSGVQQGGAGGAGGGYSSSGLAGSAGSEGSGAAGGSGGCGSLLGCGTSPTAGSAGAGGAGGAAGSGGTAILSTLATSALDLFVGTTGGTGVDGTTGAGGGGGGGGKSASAGGGGGGSGGGGADGGTGGVSPGRSGGGSFALYVYNSTANVSGSSILTSGSGGTGGSGASGGQGGNGGAGGAGGSKYCCLASDGASGGAGGNGGGGGGAGGGPGGPSITVMENGTGTVTFTGSGYSLVNSSAGSGGSGGSGGSAGSTSGGGGTTGATGSAGSSGLRHLRVIDGVAS